MVVLAYTIQISPLDRAGQVSGLAALQLRFALLALLLLAMAIVGTTVLRRWRISGLSVRVAAAGLAGLASGLVAGAVVLALLGTSWGLAGPFGDAGALQGWAKDVLAGGSSPIGYPPAFIHVLAWYADLTGDTVEHSIKLHQIGWTALFGPAAYLSWRLLLRPMWALGIGVLPALVFIDPYKPYSNLAMVMLISVLLVALRQLRRSGSLSWRRLALTGVGLGAALGLIFLVYFGWFLWLAPGVLVAALIVFPWRTGWHRGLFLLTMMAAVFVAISNKYLFWMLTPRTEPADPFFNDETWVEPAYFAMFRSNQSGEATQWPPPGEFGGVGLVTLLLFAGLAVAITVGRRRTIVLALACMLAGAWLLRFQLAAHMYADNVVRLYPRTATVILYSLLLLAGFAIYYLIRHTTTTSSIAWITSVTSATSVRIGALAMTLLLIASMGSAIGDRYMPRTEALLGSLALMAHTTRQPDGNCPTYATAYRLGCPGMGPGHPELIQRLHQIEARPGDMPHWPR
jgi:galactan 5-O-arabinofuranosyltransferase